MKPRGVTILEVLLALLILGAATAILGHISRAALRNAAEVRDITQAELLAESILAKVRIGIIEMEPVVDQPVMSRTTDVNDEVLDTNAVSEGNLGTILWYYTLEVNTVDDYGLLELAVTVRQNKPQEEQPAVCRLVRWFALEPIEEEEETEE